MKVPMLAAALALLGVLSPDSLSAQAHPETLQAVAAAIKDVRDAIWNEERLPGGPVKLDPRILTSRQIDHPAHAQPITVREFGPERDPEQSRELLRELSATPADLDSVSICPGRDLRSCHLADHAAAAFAAGEPRLRGDTAEVIVKAVWVSKIPKQPIQFGTFAVVLTRTGEQWQVASRRVITIS